MLSRMSSRVRPSACAVEDAGDQLVAADVVIEHPGREADGRIDDAVERLRAVVHLDRVAQAVLVEVVELVPGALLVGRQAGRRRRAGGERLGDLGRHGRRPCWCGCRAIRAAAAAPSVSETALPQSPPCATYLRVAEPLHQRRPCLGDARSDSSPAPSACPRSRSPAATGSRRRRHPLRCRHARSDR